MDKGEKGIKEKGKMKNGNSGHNMLVSEASPCVLATACPLEELE